jgi:hypothetical protein
MTFLETTPEIPPPVMQPEEIKQIKIRKKRAPKHDFKDGSGRIPAHRHDNGRGWVADTAKVDETVYIGPRCAVFNRAIVKGTTRLEGQASIFGNAVVSGAIIMRKNAQVYGAAVVRDSAELSDNTRVGGSAHISGTSRIYGDANVCGSAQLFAVTLAGRCRIEGSALLVRSNIHGDLSANSFVEIKGDCSVINSNVHGNAIIERQAQLIRSTLRCYADDSRIHLTDFAIVADMSTVYYPMIIKDHAVLIRTTLSNNYTNISNALDMQQITGRTVLQHQTMNTRSDLQNYLNLLAQHGGRLGAAQIMPNGQIAEFPARRVSFDQPPAVRRVMRLQEAGA